MDNELKREIILENFQHPVNKEKVDDTNYQKVNHHNPNCIDNLDFYILVEDNIIKDIKFMGEACAISTSSSSIMIKNLIGKSIKDAKYYVDNFYNMCNEQEYNRDILNEGIAFDNIYMQENRKSCALLPYNAIMKALNNYEEK